MKCTFGLNSRIVEVWQRSFSNRSYLFGTEFFAIKLDSGLRGNDVNTIFHD